MGGAVLIAAVNCVFRGKGGGGRVVVDVCVCV